MATMSTTSHTGEGVTREERRVILASSVGTIFEWYDFYLYATLAPFFAALFFPPGNDTAALLSAFATYAAGFLIRPFGAVIFGRVGDLVGRKYTFLVTIFVMGLATFAVGLLPTFSTQTLPVIGELAASAGRRRFSSWHCVSCRGWRSEENTAVPPPTSPSTRSPVSAGTRQAGSRPRPHSGSSSRSSSSARCRFFLFDAQGVRRVGLAHSLPRVALPAHFLGLPPAEAERVADLGQNEGRGQRLQATADRFLLQATEQQVRAAGASGSHGGPGCRVVHGSVLRPVLPDDHPQGRPAPRLCDGRAVAADRHAILRRSSGG